MTKSHSSLMQLFSLLCLSFPPFLLCLVCALPGLHLQLLVFLFQADIPGDFIHLIHASCFFLATSHTLSVTQSLPLSLVLMAGSTVLSWMSPWKCTNLPPHHLLDQPETLLQSPSWTLHLLIFQVMWVHLVPRLPLHVLSSWPSTSTSPLISPTCDQTEGGSCSTHWCLECWI